MEDETLLTVREVAARMRVGEETVRRWIRGRKLGAIMPGGEKGGWRVPASALAQFEAAAHQASGGESAA